MKTKGRIKILHIHTRACVGGSAYNTLYSMNGMPADVYEPMLISGPGGQFLELVKKYNHKSFLAPFLRNPINPLYDLISFLQLWWIIFMVKPDIVHTHNSKAGILGRWAARVCGVKTVIHTLHGNVLIGRCMFIQKLYIFLERLTGYITDHLIVISRDLEKLSIEKYGYKKDKISLIYSGIDAEKFMSEKDCGFLRKELDLPDNNIIVGCVGRLEDGKGHDVLINSTKKIYSIRKDIVFVCVGSGPLEMYLKKRVDMLGIKSCFKFMGTRHDIEKITRGFDIAAVPSRYEGMGRVYLEAMASGKPVIGTRVGGIIDIIDDGKNGFLIPLENFDELAEKILLLADDKSLRERMGENGRRKINEDFTVQGMVKSLIGVYKQYQ